MPFPDFVGPQGFQGPTPEELQQGQVAQEANLTRAITEPDEGGFSYQQAPQPRQAPQQGPDPNGFFFGNHPAKQILPGSPEDDVWTRDKVGQLEQAEQMVKTSDALSPEQKQTGLANIWKKLMEYDPGRQYRRSSLAGAPSFGQQMMAKNSVPWGNGLMTWDNHGKASYHESKHVPEDKQPDIAQELDHIRKTGTYTTKDADGVPTTHIPSMDDAIKEWQIMHGHRQSVLGHVRGVQGSTSQMGSSPAGSMGAAADDYAKSHFATSGTGSSQGLQAPPADEFAPKPAPHGKTAMHEAELAGKAYDQARIHTSKTDANGNKTLGTHEEAVKYMKERKEFIAQHMAGAEPSEPTTPAQTNMAKAHEAATAVKDENAVEAIKYAQAYLAKPEGARSEKEKAKYVRALKQAAAYLPPDKGATSTNGSSPPEDHPAKPVEQSALAVNPSWGSTFKGAARSALNMGGINRGVVQAQPAQVAPEPDAQGLHQPTTMEQAQYAGQAVAARAGTVAGKVKREASRASEKALEAAHAAYLKYLDLRYGKGS